jgi:hypothetical protein
MRNWICAVALTLSVGCASANFRPYIGQQQNWPTASGSIVNMKYDYPVFTSLPPGPYQVLGELRIESPFYQYPEEGHLPCLIKKAEKMNADALVFVDGEVFFSTNYGPKPGDAAATAGGTLPTLTQVNRFNPESFKPGVNILAIRWIGEPPPGLPVARRPAASVPAEEPKEEMVKPAEAPATNAAPEEVVTPAATLPADQTNQPPAAPTEAAPPPAAEQPAPTPPPAAEAPASEPPPAEPPAQPAPTQ